MNAVFHLVHAHQFPQPVLTWRVVGDGSELLELGGELLLNHGQYLVEQFLLGTDKFPEGQTKFEAGDKPF